MGGQPRVCRAIREIPKEIQVADSKKPEADTTDDPEITQLTTKLSEKAAPEPAEDKLDVKDLELTKNASDVDYKTPC